MQVIWNDLSLHHNPTSGTAALAHIEEESKVGRLHCCSHVSVLTGNMYKVQDKVHLENDVGRLAAQLEGDPLQVASSRPLDDLPHLWQRQETLCQGAS